MDNLLNRITINKDICHGKPTIRNKRIMVSTIMELLSAGITEDEILADYPALEKEDFKACYAFANILINNQPLHNHA
jgi:uncharacterized protein (DUF433 family)